MSASSDFMARWNAMTADEQAGTLDAFHHYSDRKWLAYECSDCHPDAKNDPEHEGECYDLPCTLVLPDDIDPPEHCPRCGSRLSMGRDTTTEVRITTVVRKQKQASEGAAS